MKQTNNHRIALLAGSVFALDQLTKFTVMHFIPYQSTKVIVPDFFELVHWHNTGAAWSLFHGNNLELAIVSAIALVVLVLARNKFGANTALGSFALGLIFGGITGNLFDRIVHRHVVDFLYFSLKTRSDVVHGFPAFNVADSAICVGVGLLFILSWRNEGAPNETETVNQESIHR